MMELNKGIFVKINYEFNEDSNSTLIYNNKNIDFSKKMDTTNKYLICGGVRNKNGGMMVFKAQSLEEARFIANNNPLNKIYNCKYEIFTSLFLTQ